MTGGVGRGAPATAPSPGPGGPGGPGAPEPVEEERRLLSNTAALVASRYAVAVLGWTGTLLVVRSLSVEEFGRFSFVFSLLGLVSVLGDLSLGRVAMRGLLAAGSDRARFAGALVVLRSLLGIVSYLVAVGFVVAAGYPAEIVTATAVAGVSVLLATPANAVQAVFQVHQRMRSVAVGNVLGQLAQLALVAALAARGGSVTLFVIPAVAGQAVVVAWRLAGARRLQRLELVADWRLWGWLCREALPLAAGQVLAVAYYRVDALMLSRLDSFEAVAVYGVAYKFVDIVRELPAALTMSLLPLLVAAWPGDPRRLATHFHRGLVVLVGVGALVVVEFLLFAEPIVALLYGPEYTAGAGATRVVVAAECFASFGALAFTTLVAMGRHRVYPLVALVGLVVNVALNLWLIPTLSYDGAALATLATNLLVVALLLGPLLVAPNLRPVPWRPVVRCLVAGVVAAATGVALEPVIGWIPAAGAVVAAYAVVLGRRWAGYVLSSPARDRKGRGLGGLVRGRATPGP